MKKNKIYPVQESSQTVTKRNYNGRYIKTMIKTTFWSDGTITKKEYELGQERKL